MCMAGFANLVVGAYLLTRVGMSSSQLSVSIAMLFLGFGMGLSFIATMLAGQNSVDLPRMGVATGLVNFTRQLGGALGVAVAAAVMLSTLTDRLKTLFPQCAHPGVGAAVPAGGEELPAGNPGSRTPSVRRRVAPRVRGDARRRHHRRGHDTADAAREGNRHPRRRARTHRRRSDAPRRRDARHHRAPPSVRRPTTTPPRSSPRHFLEDSETRA